MHLAGLLNQHSMPTLSVSNASGVFHNYMNNVVPEIRALRELLERSDHGSINNVFIDPWSCLHTLFAERVFRY